jgi:hypothetical protein
VGKAPGGGKRVAIVQSNYIPWKGYFDLIAASDEFILLDDVQYTRRDWRNRNKIKTPAGVQWLTIAVEVKGKYEQKISDVRVSEPDWARKHWRQLAQNYGKAPHYRAVAPEVERWYSAAAELPLLTDINALFLREVCRSLGIATRIRRSSEFTLEEGKTNRLLSLCAQAGAASYLSGPAAKDYLEVSQFSAAGISVEWMNYDGYPEYPQLFPPFDHAVTVLDLMFNTGPSATQFMKHAASE